MVERKLVIADLSVLPTVYQKVINVKEHVSKNEASEMYQALN